MSNDTITQLLSGFELDGDQPELMIDRFEQWTNPRGAVLACTCTYWPGTDIELDRVA